MRRFLAVLRGQVQPLLLAPLQGLPVMPTGGWIFGAGNVPEIHALFSGTPAVSRLGLHLTPRLDLAAQPKRLGDAEPLGTSPNDDIGMLHHE